MKNQGEALAKWFLCLTVLLLPGCSGERSVEGTLPAITLRNLEESIRKAKTLRINIRYASALPNDRKENWTDGVVTLLLKDEEKVRLECYASQLGRPISDVLISDGLTTSNVSQGERNLLQTVTPKGIKDKLAVALALVGGAYATRLIRRLHPDALHELVDFEKSISVSDVSATVNDGQAKCLSYTVNIVDPEVRMNVRLTTKLWYIPKSGQVLKRTIKSTNEPDERTVTEIYDDFGLNVEIPDEKFIFKVGK